MKKLYFTYRQTYTNRGVRYDPSYYNDKMFEDFKKSGLTEMIDGGKFVPEDRITLETVPGVKSLRRAGVLNYNENLDGEILKQDLLTTTQNFLLRILTRDEMLDWVRTNTDLEEVEEGKFLIYEKDEIREEEIYLII